MARKDLLKGLMGDPPPKDDDAEKLTAVNFEAEEAASPARPRYSKGAIGAVSQSIAELKSRALIEVPADMIDPGGLEDRLDEDPADMEALQNSLKEYGQQVPVLLRHDPNTEGRYQVVYGRRRVAALRALRMPVKAMVRNLNDRDLIVAQGQENSARRDLSFIEKANFARQMRDNGFDRKVICDALHIDKTVISRMLAIADAMPFELIRAIGPAPSVGRDRWKLLADRYEKRRTAAELAGALKRSKDLPSDQRFEEALKALTEKKEKPRPVERTFTGPDETPLARARTSGRKTVLTFDAKETGGFEEWLMENLNDLHRDWLKSRGE
ncbi:ParB-like partition protein [Pseudooceanicola batsensis HTCC2597]|uniref:ParB-like partition protein n=1 Tax=Pseudooceanicola batsensis (strain ATCC BAA-863 / DSM 15984 / KCTC 12145 / HTCC2597) TaxID=252305 RepID=A3U123_PSEBH|nr:plasmid partitioning protein RepB [Pseudooceanicola batsensis]EAQ02006.1 ParB-like partition protein [Pseudooceanicola batsensis HTCC2597]